MYIAVLLYIGVESPEFEGTAVDGATEEDDEEAELVDAAEED